MKPVIIQNLAKKNKKESLKTDPSKEEVEKAANGFFGWVLLILAIIVVGSIAIGA